MKGQVSTELLVIVALVLLVFIPLLVLVYFKANEANQQISSYQAELAVFRLASLANSVGSLGTDTTVYTNIYIPDGTIELRTETHGQGGEIILVVSTPEGPTDIVEVVKYPIENPDTLADETNAGGWMKVEIISKYSADGATVQIEKANG